MSLGQSEDGQRGARRAVRVQRGKGPSRLERLFGSAQKEVCLRELGESLRVERAPVQTVEPGKSSRLGVGVERLDHLGQRRPLGRRRRRNGGKDGRARRLRLGGGEARE